MADRWIVRFLGDPTGYVCSRPTDEARWWMADAGGGRQVLIDVSKAYVIEPLPENPDVEESV